MCDDNTLPPDSALKYWAETWQEGCAKFGKRGDSAMLYKAQLEAAGFVVSITQLSRIDWPFC